MQTITELLAQELNCRQEYIANVIALLGPPARIIIGHLLQ